MLSFQLSARDLLRVVEGRVVARRMTVGCWDFRQGPHGGTARIDPRQGGAGSAEAGFERDFFSFRPSEMRCVTV
jgi:hypothetical protein